MTKQDTKVYLPSFHNLSKLKKNALGQLIFYNPTSNQPNIVVHQIISKQLSDLTAVIIRLSIRCFYNYVQQEMAKNIYRWLLLKPVASPSKYLTQCANLKSALDC